MMRSSRPKRTPANLSESIHQQLNMYAIAAGAAGVGLLALAQPVEAKIVYTHAHVTIGLHDSYKLDLNRDGMIDFTILNTSYNNTSTWFNRLVVKAARGNAVEASISQLWQQELAEALNGGARIPAARAFYHQPAFLAIGVYTPGGFTSIGNWVNVSGRYLGLRFKIDGRTHYGWARLNVSVQKASVTGTITGFAYETIPGKSIKAGQTKEAADDPPNEGFGVSLTSPIPGTPQPASLGMLAFGAQGVPLWPRKENEP